MPYQNGIRFLLRGVFVLSNNESSFLSKFEKSYCSEKFTFYKVKFSFEITKCHLKFLLIDIYIIKFKSSWIKSSFYDINCDYKSILEYNLKIFTLLSTFCTNKNVLNIKWKVELVMYRSFCKEEYGHANIWFVANIWKRVFLIFWMNLFAFANSNVNNKSGRWNALRFQKPQCLVLVAKLLQFDITFLAS